MSELRAKLMRLLKDIEASTIGYAPVDAHLVITFEHRLDTIIREYLPKESDEVTK